MNAAILLVEDDADARALAEDVMLRLGYACTAVASGEEALRAIANEDFDLVLASVHARGIDGLELCERISGDRPGIPVVLMSASDEADGAVAALRAGAADVVTRPLDLDELPPCLERVLGARRPSLVISRLPSTGRTEGHVEELLGESDVMRQAVARILQLAELDGTVLITGESGTGKELAARALHANSSRRDGPFVAVSCAAVPAGLLESELFGHERGAYTGAVSRDDGLFKKADGGTIFLDEIGAMPVDVQPKLLRALESRAVRSVGSSREVPFDARVVAATNSDLERAVEAGTFRRDLLFRVNAFHVHMPPLRERGNDVVLLAEAFLRRLAPHVAPALTQGTKQQLRGYSWPGNVRELENCVQACLAVADDEWIGVDELPTLVRNGSRLRASPGSTLAELERRHISLVLESVSGNKTAAAHRLGIDRTTLYRKLRRLGIESPTR